MFETRNVKSVVYPFFPWKNKIFEPGYHHNGHGRLVVKGNISRCLQKFILEQEWGFWHVLQINIYIIVLIKSMWSRIDLQLIISSIYSSILSLNHPFIEPLFIHFFFMKKHFVQLITYKKQSIFTTWFKYYRAKLVFLN